VGVTHGRPLRGRLEVSRLHRGRYTLKRRALGATGATRRLQLWCSRGRSAPLEGQSRVALGSAGAHHPGTLVTDPLTAHSPRGKRQARGGVLRSPATRPLRTPSLAAPRSRARSAAPRAARARSAAAVCRARAAGVGRRPVPRGRGHASRHPSARGSVLVSRPGVGVSFPLLVWKAASYLPGLRRFLFCWR